MEQAPCISQIATLLADPKRTAMIWALMDGSAKPSEELAMLAGLSASSANAHLARLAAGGLLRIEARGRKRFFRMAAADVGAAVDALASTTMASMARSAPSRPAALLAPALLRQARLCHDHLGGQMAAALYQRMVLAKWIERVEQRIHVTPLGARHLAEHGIFTQALAHQGYSTMACDCHDWSEQQPHLGGALGAGLLQLFMQSRWLKTNHESSALQVTETGRLEIARMAAV
ncbi:MULTISPECIES: helix-turn-helix transcriptional regulator [unclassified Pseudomonas]|uniref:ArsR/SmtB family transcription factor n=1 Tax=unclassified Pseudomonas TaxID=196821 RepID=UPI001472B2B5|nr:MULTISPECIES: helix-turn-helix transcriptional regulator [unclassified Pseudomonas]NMX94603.1 helix-turn-helix transcriptional regulator [Pseudomonas sp. WS 5086]NMY49003.1 helix-turn-helix transcriptional regulator [Pseudomonas sp. WS 5027]